MVLRALLVLCRKTREGVFDELYLDEIELAVEVRIDEVGMEDMETADVYGDDLDDDQYVEGDIGKSAIIRKNKVQKDDGRR